MEPSFVIDACVIAGWLLEDEQNPYAVGAVEHLCAEAAAAPAFLLIEIGNALLCAERRRRITAAQREDFLMRVMELGLALEPLADIPSYALRVMALAHSHGLSMYDAMYLELAVRNTLPLATLDQALRRAAQKCGIAIFGP